MTGRVTETTTPTKAQDDAFISNGRAAVAGVVVDQEADTEQGHNHNHHHRLSAPSAPHHVQNGTLSQNLELCEFLDLGNQCTEKEYHRYLKNFPLLYTMMKEQETRNSYLEKDGSAQINCPKSSEGWFRSIFIWKGRALDSIAGVWSFVVLHSIVYTIIIELVVGSNPTQLTSWETYFGAVFNMTLGLLLVFRLNRAAVRWWSAREYWGLMVAKVRSLTGALLVHGGHSPQNRDDCIRWMAAMVLSSVHFLRGEEQLNPDMFAGLLDDDQLLSLQKNHPPLFAAQQVRYYLTAIFKGSSIKPPTAFSVAGAHQQVFMEDQLNSITDYIGGLERIRATPLPIVYVSHTRTFLLISLILFPYMWGPHLGWGTIPLSAITSFALLGIESCAAEVESPFGKNRPNALNMDGYALGVLGNILQMMRQHADREMNIVLTTKPSSGSIQNSNHQGDGSRSNAPPNQQA